MGNDNVVSLAAPASVSDPLTDLLRVGARRLIEAAVSAEFGEYLSAGIGAVDVRVPKARSRSGSQEPFRSSLVPPSPEGAETTYPP